MGKVSEHLRSLIEKQVNDRGIVVWYDPDGVYRQFAQRLSLPRTRISFWKDSFFRLRHEVEPCLEFLDEEGRPVPGGEVPPRVLVYVPMAREDTRHALIELEMAGGVMEPGANPWQRNTRLRVLAEHIFKKIAPDQTIQICKQVEEGLLTLEELDKLSVEMEGITSSAIKLVFGTASIRDVVLAFAASPEHDRALEAKNALPELAALLENGLGFGASELSSAENLRYAFRRFLLMGELVCCSGGGDVSDKFSSLRIPRNPEHIERVREICSVWRRRTDHREAYLEASQAVADEMELAACAFPLDSIVGLETFSILERKLLNGAESFILNGEPRRALDLACSRKTSFWSNQEPDYQIRWVLIENGSKILILGENIRDQVKKLKEDPVLFVCAYTDGGEPWYILDKLYRHLERQYSHFDLDMGNNHASLEKLMVLFRQHYTKTVETTVVRFVRALQKADFQLAGCFTQDHVYRDQVYPMVSIGKKTAYFLVDALRYEMGQELVEGLKDEFDVNLIPGAAHLPTITSVGMAALMPGAENGLELVETAGGKPAVGIGSSILRDRASRIKHFQGSASPDLLVLKLKDLIKPSSKRQQAIKAAGFILVTSQEIDQYGEEIDDESEARIIMDEVLDKLRKAIRRLASLGIEAFVITADHGHLFGENIEGGMLMDSPGGKILELHRRVWIGQGGVAADGFIRVPASQLNLGGSLELAFPGSLGCFKTKGAGGAYCHGGISLQEMILPVISLAPKKTVPYAVKTTVVQLTMEKPKITTRFFSVVVTYRRYGMYGPDEIRVKAAVMSQRKEVGFAAMAAYGFEEGTREIVLRRDQPNALTFMLTGEGLDHVSVHVTDALSQVELAKIESIPVNLAI